MLVIDHDPGEGQSSEPGHDKRRPSRRRLSDALAEAGLGDAPVVVMDDGPPEQAVPSTMRTATAPATTVVVGRRARVEPATADLASADVAPAQVSFGGAWRGEAVAIEDVTEAEDAGAVALAAARVWRRRGAGPDLPFYRARRWARLRERLVNGMAWIATCVFTIGVLIGAGYLMGGAKTPAPPPVIMVE